MHWDGDGSSKCRWEGEKNTEMMVWGENVRGKESLNETQGSNH